MKTIPAGRGKRKESNLTPAGRGKRTESNLTPPTAAGSDGNLTPPEPPIPAGRGRMKATIFVRSEAGGNRRASSLTPSQSSGSESDSSDSSDGEAIDDAIADFDEWMEDGAEILQADLEIISKQFGYGEKVGKEKDLILKLVEKCETQQSPEALEVVVEYVITKLRLLMSTLRILLGGSMYWNRKVAKCVYHATQKFKEEFFADFEDVETLIQAADRLIKLGDDDDGDWLITAGCSYLKVMVGDLNQKGLYAILAQCLVKYPTLEKATLEELKKLMPW